MTLLEFANLFSQLFMGYLGIGLIFALIFVFALVGKIDPSAKEGTVGFRVMIIPGTIALWPLLLMRVIRGKTLPEEKNAHRTAACQMHCATAKEAQK